MILPPLYNLLRKDVSFEWTSKCERSFRESKELLLRADILTHYDPRKSIVVSCDSSGYGIGATLSHIIDGVARPILFASSILSDSEKNYSMLQREALAIAFAVK